MSPFVFRLVSVLFDLRLTFSYISAYFALSFDSVSEPLSMPIRVFTLVSDFLVVDWVYRYCVVIIVWHETLVDLLMRLHVVSMSIILDQGPKFTSHF